MTCSAPFTIRRPETSNLIAPRRQQQLDDIAVAIGTSNRSGYGTRAHGDMIDAFVTVRGGI